MTELQWWIKPFVACFDGEAAEETSETPSEEGSEIVVPKSEGDNDDRGDDEKTFTQEDLNKFLAEDRRKHQKKVDTLEKQYETLLNNQSLSEQERQELEASREEMRSQFQTKEQKLIADRKKVESELSEKLKAATEKADTTWKMYEGETIQRSLLDAAAKHEAFNPQQLTTMMRNQSKLVEQKNEKGKPTGQFTVMVELADQDAESGDPITTIRTPDDAVKRMKELPSLYGNLFKTGVVSGLGGSSATGGMAPGSNGKLSRDQIAKLSPTEYRKIRADNPELLGFGNPA